MSQPRSGPVVPADIITYRHNQKLVYVKPAETYEKALDIAQKEFEELQGVPRHRIALAVTSSIGGQRQLVRISESAWPSASARLLRGEVVDIYIRPDPDAKLSLEVPPPQYLEVPRPHSTDLSDGKTKTASGRGSKSNPSSRSTSPASTDRGLKSWFS